MEIGLWGDHAVCVCVCVCLSPYQLLNGLVDFHEIWQRGDIIQGDDDAVLFNPMASTI
jgi:hypothetical protein